MTHAKLDRSEIFAKMPVRSAVLRQILPAIASQMTALIYNLADTYFVGRLDDPNQTAAVTVATAAFLMLTAISNLFGVGGASVISRLLGKERAQEAKKASAFSFCLVCTYKRGCIFRYSNCAARSDTEALRSEG